MEDFGWHGDEFMLGDCLDDRMGWAGSTNDFWAHRMDPEGEDEWEMDDEEGIQGEDAEWDDGDDWDALASAGHGTDEDYGYYGDSNEW